MEEDVSKKKNSPVVILLLVAGVVAIGGGAYLLGNSAARLNTQTQAMGEAGYTAEQELDNCFNYVAEMAPTDEDIANWQTFAGYGYSIKYPEDVVSIEEIEAEASDGRGDGFLLSYLDGQYEADIYTQELGIDTFRVSYQHSAPLVYEPYSDTWWIDTYTWSGAWPAEGFEECNPNSSGVTNDGENHIYYKSGAEPGAFNKYYYVVLRNVEQDDSYTPLIVKFGASVGENYKNNSRSANFHDKYEGVEEFVDILENIIKTMEPTPTSRG